MQLEFSIFADPPQARKRKGPHSRKTARPTKYGSIVLHDGTICPRQLSKNGYLYFRAWGKTIHEHVYLWEQWTGQKVPKGWVVHHRDERKTNNYLWNLEPMTRKQHQLVHQQKHFGPCAVEGCERKATKKTYCDNHYELILRREQNKERQRRYQQEHKEQGAAKMRAWRAANAQRNQETARRAAAVQRATIKADPVRLEAERARNREWKRRKAEARRAARPNGTATHDASE